MLFKNKTHDITQQRIRMEWFLIIKKFSKKKKKNVFAIEKNIA